MNQFKAGDIVQLKSGGPKMTVAHPGAGEGRVYCQWFAGNKLESGNFAEESLVKVEDENKRKG